MSAITPGHIAPNMQLPGVSEPSIKLENALRKGPVVLAFFKISCPICQYAFPYLQRMRKNYEGANVTFIGVSQDDAQATKIFMREYGITFPVVLDNPRLYPASNAYGITNVPTTFYIAQDGEVQMTIIGWSRADMEELNRRIAEHIGSGAPPLFHKGEQVSDFRAG